MSFMKNLLKTSALVGVSAGIGTAVTDPDSLWYKTRKKPAIQPPTIAFPIAWTALYASIAVASAKAITAGQKKAALEAPMAKIDLNPVADAKSRRRSKKELKKALKDIKEHQDEAQADTESGKQVKAFKRALVLNLILNTGWSALFWQGRNLKVAAIEAGALAISSADLARCAGKLDKVSGAMLIPYAGWTAFATVLSTRLEQVN